MKDKKINNCSWGFKCTQTWKSLKETLNHDIRFCTTCKKDVFKTSSQKALTENLELERCMYFAEEFRPLEQEGDGNIIVKHSVGFMVSPPIINNIHDSDDDK